MQHKLKQPASYRSWTLGVVMHKFIFAPVLLITAVAAGCAYRVPASLEASRSYDTLSVAIRGEGVTRWDPTRDSLVIECPDCDVNGRPLVERFETRTGAQYQIPAAEGIKLTLYSMGHRDTLDLAGTGTPGEKSEVRRLANRRYRPAAPKETTEVVTKPKPDKVEAPEKPKKPATIKVTAPEGIAVYKDKTKREVLKILPQGSILPLLAHEGDLYSVSVDGQEGFVEAEAVSVQE